MNEPPGTEVRPFSIEIPQAEIDDLRDRLCRTRWPQGFAASEWSRGVPLEYLKGLVGRWIEFDWRKQEAALNEHPQFKTEIDGQDIHFVHVRSPHPEATPLILTHGWPSSPFEFTRLIRRLTDAHGGDPDISFHLVIPSLPGYGFSTPVSQPGWGNLFRVAQAWAELMTRLGYERYAVHGTDAGSGVAGILGMIDGERVIGTHVAGTVAAMPFGPPLELEGLSDSDARRAARFNEMRENGIGYLQIQATRPQTLAYALNDSPVGQLAWIADKVREWTDPANELPEDAVGLDALLTNVSIFWFTGAGASSAHATFEGIQAWREMRRTPVGDTAATEDFAGPPAAVAVFAADTTIRSAIDPGERIARWSEFDRGGHFPAMEVPELLAHDLIEFFGELRPTGAPHT
jgi:epoxide hydrolase